MNFSEALFSVSFDTRDCNVPDNVFICFYSLTRFQRHDDNPAGLRLATCFLLSPVQMRLRTYEYKQSYGKLFELFADCTVLPPKNAMLQTETFILNELYFNGLWTIMSLFQQLQQFFDHFETDTTLFTMTILGNILLHNVMGHGILLSQEEA